MNSSASESVKDAITPMDAAAETAGSLRGFLRWQLALTVVLLLLLGVIDHLEHWMHGLGEPGAIEWLIQAVVVCGFVVIQLKLFKRANRELKFLQGLMHACANCRRVRSNGSWIPLESFLSEHTRMKFSHGFCPECLRRLYPEIADSLESENQSELKSAIH